MKRVLPLLLLSSVFALFSCSGQGTSESSSELVLPSSSESMKTTRIDTIDVTNEEHVRPLGRCLAETGGLYFAYSEAGFALEVENEEETFSLSIAFESQIASPYKNQFVNVYLDGAFVEKKELGKGTQNVVIPLSASLGRHQIEVKKANEGQFSSLLLESIAVTGGAAHLIETPRKKKIEFFGDSITCGYGVLAESNRETFSMATEDSRFTYAAIAADEIGYEASLVSYSGIAIAISPFVSNGYSMMDVYDTVDGAKKYDLAAHPSDAFVINLGTNDNTKYNTLLSAEEKESAKALFVEHYIALIRAMLATNPKAPVVICYNMMTSLNKDLVYGIDAVWRDINGDYPGQITALAFDGDNLGADGHPGKVAHEENGQRLAEHLKTIL